MSFIIPFLTSPADFSRLAYKAATFELPLARRFIHYSDDWVVKTERVYKSDPGYNLALKDLPGYHIKEEIQPFLDRAKIREDLIVVERLTREICAAEGTNIFSKSDAAVYLAPGFYDADKEACHWVMKHEISHIKNNDTFIVPLVASICSTAAAVFGVRNMHWLSATLLTISVGITTHSLFSIWREGKADDFAIENSSNEELLGGRRFLIATESLQNWKYKLDYLHPSIISRLQKVEKILGKKGILIDDAQENQKIEELKLFLVNNQNEAERTVVSTDNFFGSMREAYRSAKQAARNA